MKRSKQIHVWKLFCTTLSPAAVFIIFMSRLWNIAHFKKLLISKLVIKFEERMVAYCVRLTAVEEEEEEEEDVKGWSQSVVLCPVLYYSLNNNSIYVQLGYIFERRSNVAHPTALITLKFSNAINSVLKWYFSM